VAAWIALAAFISFYLAQRSLLAKYPPIYLAPRPPGWLLLSRNISLYVALGAGLVGLPRWQAILGLVATLCFYFLVMRY
jgi:hypothetical protein